MLWEYTYVFLPVACFVLLYNQYIGEVKCDFSSMVHMKGKKLGHNIKILPSNTKKKLTFIIVYL